MSPSHKLAGLCRRFDVPYEDAVHLLPLITRGVEADDSRIRRSVQNLVETALARIGEERRARRRLEEHLERQYLNAIAAVLHRWRPRTE